jgi:hypothetical protein
LLYKKLKASGNIATVKEAVDQALLFLMVSDAITTDQVRDMTPVLRACGAQPNHETVKCAQKTGRMDLLCSSFPNCAATEYANIAQFLGAHPELSKALATSQIFTRRNLARLLSQPINQAIIQIIVMAIRAQDQSVFFAVLQALNHTKKLKERGYIFSALQIEVDNPFVQDFLRTHLNLFITNSMDLYHLGLLNTGNLTYLRIILENIKSLVLANQINKNECLDTQYSVSVSHPESGSREISGNCFIHFLINYLETNENNRLAGKISPNLTGTALVADILCSIATPSEWLQKETPKNQILYKNLLADIVRKDNHKIDPTMIDLALSNDDPVILESCDTEMRECNFISVINCTSTNPYYTILLYAISLKTPARCIEYLLSKIEDINMPMTAEKGALTLLQTILTNQLITTHYNPEEFAELLNKLCSHSSFYTPAHSELLLLLNT